MQIGQYTAIGGLKSRRPENFESIPCHDNHLQLEIDRKYDVIMEKVHNNKGTSETWFDIENHFHNSYQTKTPKSYANSPKN